MECWQLEERAFNQFSFCEFLTSIREVNGRKKICLFLDNLRLHQTGLVRDTYRDFEIKAIFNAPYSPNQNPIEKVFLWLKDEYLKIRVSDQAAGINREKKQRIRLSIEAIQRNLQRYGLPLSASGRKAYSVKFLDKDD